ncbi:MAG: hypothetical protein Q8P41_10225 [Pseudomonadota bacterium]|nr:hypothetical protein [Pseudomonadota bacterium]
MSWLLLLLACPPPAGPATTGSRSADLALRAGEVGRRADVLAERTRTLEGLFDDLRAAPPDAREPIRASIEVQAEALKVEAESIRDEVVAIEDAARVW